MSNISISASNFAASYAAASALGADPSKSVTSVADALASHYPLSKPFSAFTFGQVTVFPDREYTAHTIRDYLQGFVDSGLGIDISMANRRIEVVSPGSALCWITWSIKPKDGTQGWTWENVYGYRRTVAWEGQIEPQEYWEFVVSDQEIGALMERKPEIMKALTN